MDSILLLNNFNVYVHSILNDYIADCNNYKKCDTLKCVKFYKTKTFWWKVNARQHLICNVRHLVAGLPELNSSAAKMRPAGARFEGAAQIKEKTGGPGVSGRLIKSAPWNIESTLYKFSLYVQM